MNVEDIPKKVLSHTGCTVCGFLIALWCQETSAPDQTHRKVKSGFTITLNNEHKNEKGRDLAHVENPVLISQNANELCRWSRSGPLVRWRDDHIQLMGDIATLDSALKIVDGLKAGLLDITSSKNAESMPTCQDLPLITYGPHP